MLCARMYTYHVIEATDGLAVYASIEYMPNWTLYN